MAEGLQHVYTGNVHDREGGTTFCPACDAELIVRDWHRIVHYALRADGRCPHCDTSLAGRFEQFEKGYGARRKTVRIAQC
jgi:pyruvate formate lyase activating enzyme